jgi:hypothetical protein
MTTYNFLLPFGEKERMKGIPLTSILSPVGRGSEKIP